MHGRSTVSPVHVVIMGCGRVGSTLAKSLEDRSHDVSVIDSNPDAFRRLGPSFDGAKVTGIGFDQTVLERARHRATGRVELARKTAAKRLES